MAAKAELKINATADTRAAKTALDDLERKGKQAVKNVGKTSLDISKELENKNREGIKNLIGKLAGVAIAIKGISVLLRAVSSAFGKLVATGEALHKAAQELNLSDATLAALKARADEAGLSEKEYAAALDELKKGKTTLGDIQQKWRDIARESHEAGRATTNFTAELSKNLLALETARAKSMFSGAFERFGDTVVRFGANVMGKGTQAESFIEQMIRDPRVGTLDEAQKGRLVEQAIERDFYSKTKGTERYNKRAEELRAYLEERLAQIAQENTQIKVEAEAPTAEDDYEDPFMKYQRSSTALAFSKGGGALASLNYFMPQKDPLTDLLEASRAQIDQAKTANDKLAEISQKLND